MFRYYSNKKGNIFRILQVNEDIETPKEFIDEPWIWVSNKSAGADTKWVGDTLKYKENGRSVTLHKDNIFKKAAVYILPKNNTINRAWGNIDYILSEDLDFLIFPYSWVKKMYGNKEVDEMIAQSGDRFLSFLNKECYTFFVKPLTYGGYGEHDNTSVYEGYFGEDALEQLLKLKEFNDLVEVPEKVMKKLFSKKIVVESLKR